MKLLHTTLITLAVSTTAIAQTAASQGLADMAGAITVNYGDMAGNAEGNYGPDDAFTYYGIEGSVGSAGNGGFGWQLDAHTESASTTNDVSFYSTYGATAHANFDLGGTTVGAFAGAGVGDNIDNGHTSSMSWYGLEAAKSFGDVTLAAQVGLASGVNDHSGNSLDFSDMMFSGIQARYFMNDNTMFTAKYATSTGTIHSSTLLQTNFDIEGMMRLGGSSFYGTAAYRTAYMNGDYDGGSEGQGGEQGFEIGLTMLFGGGSLRDTYAGSTPMINNTTLTQMGVNTSTYD